MSFIKRLFGQEKSAPLTPVRSEHNQLTSLGRPEKPITDEKQDRLVRLPFVHRLGSALIDPATSISSGVVIGITGQWGSGKSSILNLLRNHLKETYPQAIIVSFDPWLISGRNDLISQFLSELIAALRPASKKQEKTQSVINALSDYADTLSPALDLVTPGLGIAGKIGAKGLKAISTPDKSLASLRKKLEKLLTNFPVPIVVTIDELDRVEDHEIRAVAQLVRSVVDFPNISYVLAYDPQRVIQALGEGATPAEREKRGSAYLEKIVQLQVPLPVTFGEELIKLLNSELAKLPLSQGMPRDFAKIERYQELTTALLQGAMQTPRDVSRLVGTFHALVGMIGNEIDRVDLLAYSALVAKSPRTVQRLRDDPEDFSDDIISARALIRRMSAAKETPEQKLKAVLPDDGDQRGTVDLLKFLFPIFRDRGRATDEQVNRLSRRRPLLTALRLGLMPGSFSQEDIEKILTAESNEVTASLERAKNDDTIGSLLDRIDDVYSTFDMPSSQHVYFWRGVAKFLCKPDCEWPTTYDAMHEIIRDSAGILERSVKRNPKRIDIAAEVFRNLRSEENVLTALWIRDHIFKHNLFGHTSQDRDPPFLTIDQTKALAIDFSKEMKLLHLSDRLIPCRYDLQPVYTMVDVGEWDEVCKKKLLEEIVEGGALDGFTLMLYGANFSTERKTIDKICGYEAYHDRVTGRIASPEFNSLHESVQLALKKAADPFF